MSIRSSPSRSKLASILLQKRDIVAQIPELTVSQGVAKFGLSLFRECLREQNAFVTR